MCGSSINLSNYKAEGRLSGKERSDFSLSKAEGRLSGKERSDFSVSKAKGLIL